MPNTEVKLLNVDGTWWATARESRKLPEHCLLTKAVNLRPVGQEVKTRPFHGCNASSILARVTINVMQPFFLERLFGDITE